MSRDLMDIRYSARGFARTPGLTLALLFTIALGIGSNVTVHGFVRGLTIRDSPVKGADRVVSLFRRDAHREAGPVSYEDYLSLKGHLDEFEWIGAARVSQGPIRLSGHSAIVSVAAVTPDLASLLKLPLHEGAVISHRMWQSEFGANANVSGERIRIGGLDVRVAGVAPDWLEGVYQDRTVDLWMPLREESLHGRDRSIRNLWVLGRLRPDVSTHQAQTGVGAGRSGFGGIRVLPYTGMTPEMSEGLSRVGTLLRVAAGFVFFIACANVASFLLGRATAHSHETSIRVALGASRGQLARAVLSDSVVISVAGGALGVLLAVWTSKVVPALLFQEDAERLVFAPDLFSIAAASAACAGIIIVCGLLPLLETPHDRPAAVLRREGSGPSKVIRGLRSGLVIAQMTCCCILVVSTGFLLEGLHAARQTSITHRLGQPVLATVQAHPDVGVKYFRDIEHAAQSVADVSGMAWAERLPGSHPTWRSFRIEPQGLPLREVTMDRAAFTSDSLALFTSPPIAGRLFGFRDQTCRVAIVNEEGAEVLFAGDTVGRSIHDVASLPTEIIGVVALRNAKPTKGNRPTIYYNYTDQMRRPPDGIVPARFRAPTVSTLKRAELDANVVSPSYFAAMGLSLIAGQIFPADPKSGGCRVGVINQGAADLYFSGNAVGAAVIDDIGRRTGIIGVVHSARLGTFQRRVEPAIYFPMIQDYLPRMTLILGAQKVSDSILLEVRRTFESVPGRGPAPLVVKTLDMHLGQTALAPLRIATAIIGASATTALLLSVLGLYGTLTDAARQRDRELAVRFALGAQRWHVIGQVLREGGRFAAAGTLAGMLGWLLLSRWLPRITPSHGSPGLWVWLAGPLVLAGAVAIASLLPARRALMVDPLKLMRDNT